MTNLDSTLKSRDVTLLTKVRLVKAVVFPVVMYEYESWTIKKAECQRIDAFELWGGSRLWRVPWTARSSNQSVVKENSECSLEGLMLKWKQGSLVCCSPWGCKSLSRAWRLNNEQRWPIWEKNLRKSGYMYMCN